MPKTYKSCDDIPVYNFFKLLKETDLSFIIINHENFKKDKIDKYISENKNELQKKADSIVEEYKILIFNQKEISRKKEEATIIYETAIVYSVGQIIDLYKEYEDDSILKMVNSIEGFSEEMSLSEIEQKLKILVNKINIKKLNFKKKYRIKENDEAIEDTNVFKNLDFQAIQIEQILELGYKLNIKKTSVLRWVNLLDLVTQKKELNGKLKHKHAKSN